MRELSALIRRSARDPVRNLSRKQPAPFLSTFASISGPRLFVPPQRLLLRAGVVIIQTWTAGLTKATRHVGRSSPTATSARQLLATSLPTRLFLVALAHPRAETRNRPMLQPIRFNLPEHQRGVQGAFGDICLPTVTPVDRVNAKVN